jgi:hypothetical protein
MGAWQNHLRTLQIADRDSADTTRDLKTKGSSKQKAPLLRAGLAES